MDPITHALLGAAVAAPYAKNRTTLIFGALGGLAPDLDVITRFSPDPLLFVEFHRHFTHSLFFAPIGALILFLPFRFFKRFAHDHADIFLALFLGILSHDILDACTSYGTLLYWPIKSTRVAFDVLSIVDPIVTSVLLFSILRTWFKHNASPAIWSLFFMLAYIVFGQYQHSQALQVQAQMANLRQQPVVKGRVMPTLGNLFVWRSIYQTGDKFQTDLIRVDPLAHRHVRPGTTIAMLKPETIQNSKFKTELTQFQAFADGYLALFPNNLIGDLRYSYSPEGITPIWGLQANSFSTTKPFNWVQNPPERMQEKLKTLFQDVISYQHLTELPKDKTTL